MAETTAIEDTARQNEEILMAMLGAAQAAPEPGTLRARDVVSKGDSEDAPIPAIVSSITSAGYVTIYDLRTGEPSLTSRNLLPAQLRKKNVNGETMFGLRQLHEPRRGAHKCLLHPDNPERSHWDVLGFGVCRKANLASPFQVERHMNSRHHTEWETIQRERKEKQEAEDRELQRAILRTTADAVTRENARERKSHTPSL